MFNKKPTDSKIKNSTAEAIEPKSAQADAAVKSTTAIPRPKQNLTQIKIRYDVGFGNHITIRGQGAPGLSWEKGVQLKNVKPNEWTWESNTTFALVEFKILINDRIYETGPNHSIKCGSSTEYTPHF